MKATLLACLLVAPAFAQHATLVPDSVEEVRLFYWSYHRGDSAEWANSAYDDAEWTTIRSFDYDLPIQQKGTYWLRSRVSVAASDNSPKQIVLKIFLLQSAYDVYWNGSLIGSNGIVGRTEDDEQPGNAVFVLPVIPLTGQNGVSIRLSNFDASTPSGALFYARLESGGSREVLRSRDLMVTLPFIGVCLAGAIIGFSLYAAGGRFKNYLYYALVCLGLMMARVLLFAELYWNFSLKTVSALDPFFVGAYYLAELAIVFFILFSFGIPRRQMHVVWFCALMVIFFVVNLTASFFKLLNYDWLRAAVVPYCLTLLLFATSRKQAGSVIALAGYSVYSVPTLLLILGASFPGISFDCHATFCFFHSLQSPVVRCTNSRNCRKRSKDVH